MGGVIVEKTQLFSMFILLFSYLNKTFFKCDIFLHILKIRQTAKFYFSLNRKLLVKIKLQCHKWWFQVNCRWSELFIQSLWTLNEKIIFQNHPTFCRKYKYVYFFDIFSMSVQCKTSILLYILRVYNKIRYLFLKYGLLVSTTRFR